MLIVGDEILRQGLLKDADETHIKNASYYLTIGAIIPVGEEAESYDFARPNQSLVIKPRQVAWVVSKEVFNIKSHAITALVTLRSTFTKKGLLALDVGLVDPDFEGPIGSIVINFSKNDIPLMVGQEFFRVVFVTHPEVPEKFRTPRVKTTALQYAQDRYNEIVQGFPATFLNTDVLSDEVADKVTEKVSSDILDQVILHLIKKYWIRLLLGVLGLGIVTIVVAYVLLANFGPRVSRDDVQKMIQTWVEQHLPKEAPQRH